MRQTLNNKLWAILGGLVGFTLLLQLEIWWQYFQPTATQPLWEIGQILCSQQQNLLAGIVFSFSFLLLSPYRWGKIVFNILLFISLVYLTLDHIFYSLYTEHIQLNYLIYARQEMASINSLLESFWAQISGVVLFNIGLACLLFFYLSQRFSSINSYPLPFLKSLVLHSREKQIIAILLLYLTIGTFWSGYDRNRNLTEYPFYTLIKSWSEDNNFQSDLMQVDTSINLISLKYGVERTNSLIEAPIHQYFNTRTSNQPNVIFIILESIGARNIFPEAPHEQLDATLTPNLFKWKNNMITFPYIYNIYPSTSRTHITINTGGYAATWMDYRELFFHPFTGATLAKEFKESGYKNGLFSSLILKSGDTFYKQMPFDKRIVPDDPTFPITEENQLTFWGFREEAVMIEAIDWIQQLPKDQPYFLQLLTNASHHPYTIPKNHPIIFDPSSSLNHHKNTLHYVDHTLGKLLNYLEKSGTLEHTVIAITGDHGEAFGRWHPTNLTHGKYLYEESVQNFLLVLDAAHVTQNKISQKRGGIGDIMPSLLAISGKKTNVLGQNLFTPFWKSRLRFMHKKLGDANWGLIDGEWKYISDLENPNTAELYNLAEDPYEQENLAAEHTEQIKEYQKLCESWYLKAASDFSTQFKDGKWESLTANDLYSPGPNKVKIGIQELSKFQELTQIHPEESFGLSTRGWGGKKEKRMGKIHWVNPSGKKITFEQAFLVSWNNLFIPSQLVPPLKVGIWQYILEEDGNTLIEGQFQVSSEATLYQPHKEMAYFKTLDIGIMKKKKFIPAYTIRPNAKITGYMTSWPTLENIPLLMEWISPNNEIFQKEYIYQKGWLHGWSYAPPIRPMASGQWTLKVYKQEKKTKTKVLLMSKNFSVSASPI